jgi:hypothetical protein
MSKLNINVDEEYKVFLRKRGLTHIKQHKHERFCISDALCTELEVYARIKDVIPAINGHRAFITVSNKKLSRSDLFQMFDNPVSIRIGGTS